MFHARVERAREGVFLMGRVKLSHLDTLTGCFKLTTTNAKNFNDWCQMQGAYTFCMNICCVVRSRPPMKRKREAGF